MMSEDKKEEEKTIGEKMEDTGEKINYTIKKQFAPDQIPGHQTDVLRDTINSMNAKSQEIDEKYNITEKTEETQDKTKGAFDSINEKGREIDDKYKLTEKADKVIDKLRDKTEEVQKQIVDTAEKAKDYVRGVDDEYKITETADKAASSINEGFHKAGEQINEASNAAFNKILHKIDDWENELPANNALFKDRPVGDGKDKALSVTNDTAEFKEGEIGAPDTRIPPHGHIF